MAIPPSSLVWMSIPRGRLPEFLLHLMSGGVGQAKAEQVRAVPVKPRGTLKAMEEGPFVIGEAGKMVSRTASSEEENEEPLTPQQMCTHKKHSILDLIMFCSKNTSLVLSKLQMKKKQQLAKKQNARPISTQHLQNCTIILTHYYLFFSICTKCLLSKITLARLAQEQNLRRTVKLMEATLSLPVAGSLTTHW